MRRRFAPGQVLPVAVVLVALALLASGCSTKRPGGSVVTPTPSKIVGAVPKPPAAVTGNAAGGKAVFTAQGCAACHTFAAAGATGKVGPDLDKLAQYAQAANQGSLSEFVSSSITDPAAYVEKGFTAGIMPATYTSLSPQQLADLVAFLTH